MNDKNNLLQIEEHMYILDDVAKPNVFRNMFPYEEVPKIPFNDRIVPHNMPKDIWITATTFRDGQQDAERHCQEYKKGILWQERLRLKDGLVGVRPLSCPEDFVAKKPI